MRRATLLTIGLLALTACGSDSTANPGSPPPSDAAPPPASDPEPPVTEPPTTSDPDPSSPDPTSPPTEPSTSPDATAPATGASTTIDPDTLTATQREFADVAIADLATRIDVDADVIGVRSVEEVTWRDGAIGCPDPDFQYTQALVPGILVVLDVDGFAYHYHQGGSRELFYCPNPAAPIDD